MLFATTSFALLVKRNGTSGTKSMLKIARWPSWQTPGHKYLKMLTWSGNLAENVRHQPESMVSPGRNMTHIYPWGAISLSSFQHPESREYAVRSGSPLWKDDGWLEFCTILPLLRFGDSLISTLRIFIRIPYCPGWMGSLWYITWVFWWLHRLEILLPCRRR